LHLVCHPLLDFLLLQWLRRLGLEAFEDEVALLLRLAASYSAHM
jgi:hypothetical protein